MTPRSSLSFVLLSAMASTFDGVQAFSVGHQSSSFGRARQRVPVPAATSSTTHKLPFATQTRLDFSSTAAGSDAMPRPSDWEERLATDEVQSIREELVSKYLHQGWSRDDAEEEVDAFLPTNKGRAYCEMRLFADSQEEMGWETAVTYATAFFIGVGYQIFLNNYY